MNKKCERCENLMNHISICGLCGYEGTGVLDGKFPMYNMRCLKKEGSHPPFPFELWGYIGFIIKNEKDLKQALIDNTLEGERRRKAGV